MANRLPSHTDAARSDEFGRIRSERIGYVPQTRQFVDTSLNGSNGDTDILFRVKRHVVELLLASLAWMCAVEVECEQVAELKLLVVLEQVRLLEPVCRGAAVISRLSRFCRSISPASMRSATGRSAGGILSMSTMFEKP